MSQPNNKKMPLFPEMWESAKNYGADIDSLAEDVYNILAKNKIPPEIIQTVLNILAQSKGYQEYLNDNKPDKSDLNTLAEKLKNHKHVNGEVVIPLE